ncbi:MAG: DNA repair protein RecO [Crocinitomicaceae bacterium]
MYHTEGIVLQKVDYSETSLIIKVLTAESGIQSFIFQGAKRKNKKGNLVSPMAVLSIEYSLRSDSELGKIRSIEPALVYKNIPFDPYRSTVLFFMNEIMNKVAKEHNADEELYAYVRSMLEMLDLSDHIANFPIKFLYSLTKHLGFYPRLDKKYESGKFTLYLDLQEGKYVTIIPNHPFYLSAEKSSLLLRLSGMNFDEKNDPDILPDTRRKLVYDLLKYYQIVFDNFGEVKSLSVLEAVLRS